MQTILIFAAMGLVTYLARFAMIAALGRTLPALARRWLRHIPVAVLAALVAPAALAPSGRLELGPNLWAALFRCVRTLETSIPRARAMSAWDISWPSRR